MWYEILPTLGIFTTFLMLPTITPWFVHMAFRGKTQRNKQKCDANCIKCNNTYQKPHRRTAMFAEDKKFLMRDDRLTGNYFKMNGLDAIPDPK